MHTKVPLSFSFTIAPLHFHLKTRFTLLLLFSPLIRRLSALKRETAEKKNSLSFPTGTVGYIDGGEGEPDGAMLICYPAFFALYYFFPFRFCAAHFCPCSSGSSP